MNIEIGLFAGQGSYCTMFVGAFAIAAIGAQLIDRTRINALRREKYFYEEKLKNEDGEFIPGDPFIPISIAILIVHIVVYSILATRIFLVYFGVELSRFLLIGFDALVLVYTITVIGYYFFLAAYYPSKSGEVS